MLSHAEMDCVHPTANPRISVHRIYIELGQAVSKSKSVWKGHKMDVILPVLQPMLLSNSVEQDLINNNHSLIKAKILKSFKSHLIYPKAEVHL